MFTGSRNQVQVLHLYIFSIWTTAVFRIKKCYTCTSFPCVLRLGLELSISVTRVHGLNVFVSAVVHMKKLYKCNAYTKF
jgi:hypothetical protein